jgi:hypothetical protein
MEAGISPPWRINLAANQESRISAIFARGNQGASINAELISWRNPELVRHQDEK